MMHRYPKLFQCFYVILFFFIVTGFWEFVIIHFQIQEIVLPPPSLIGSKMKVLVSSLSFWDNYIYTLHEVFLGYLLAVSIALFLGIIISQSKILRLGLLPYVIAFQTIPTVALAPIFLQWFGYGMASKIIMAALIAFFPILVNIIAGLQAAPHDEIQMLKSFGASKIQVLTKVRIPNSLPFVFAGLDLGIIFALIGAIVAEFVGAQKGLGKMLLQFNEQFDIAGMFAVLGTLAITGMILHGIVEYIKSKIVFWD